jgi:hypothetical protein
MGANQVKIVDLLGQSELAGTSKAGVTIKRVHGTMVFPTGVNANWEYAIGVNPVTTVGTLLPNPNGDNDLDWMLFKRVPLKYAGATLDANLIEEVNLRSQRRCSEMGQTLTLNLWNGAISAGTVTAFFRVLVALP